MEFEKKLSGEYLEVYDEIVDEMESEELPVGYIKEIKNDILEMLLSAQNDRLSPKKLIGTSSRKFVEELVLDFRKSNSVFYKIGQMIFQFFIVFGIFSLLSGEGNTLEISLGLLITSILMPISNLLAIKLSKKIVFGLSRKVRLNIIGLIIFAIGVVLVINIEGPTLITVNNPFKYMIIIALVGIIGNNVLERKFN